PGSYRFWVGFARTGGQPSGVELPGQLQVSGVARSFEMPPIAHPRDVDFGDGVRLAGWDVARPTLDKARLTLYWRPTATPTHDYHVFNHVLDAGEKIVSQRDGVPVDWSRPTTGWLAGEAIVDVYELDTPPGSGPLRLRIGVYEPTSGQRLRTP